MIGLIKVVWTDKRPTAPWTGRASIIVIDQATGKLVKTFVWMDSPKGKWIASLCEEAEANGKPHKKFPVVLTLAPPNALGWHRIEDAERMPQEVPHDAA